jgi:hypothetical protein
MTWQTVTVIALAIVLIVVLIGMMAWYEACSTRRHLSDNEVRMAELAHKTAAIPRSIFGSGMPLSPATMHHSGGLGKAKVNPQ